MKDLTSYSLSFWSGLQGGVIGGSVAALPITLGYYRQQTLPLREVGEVMLYAVLVGAVTGVAAQLGMTFFRRLADTRKWPVWLFNEASGASLVCAVGGLLVGGLGGLWFGLRPSEPIDGPLVVGGALLGAAVVLYDTGGRLRRMVFYCLIPLPLSIGAAYLAFRFLKIDLYAEDSVGALFDGARLGMVVGFVMGIQIGVGLFLYRHRTWPDPNHSIRDDG